MASFFGNLFSFLTKRPGAEDVVAEHVIREHHQGRTLTEILQDDYATNRVSAEQVAQILDRPEVIHAVGDDVIAAHHGASS